MTPGPSLEDLIRIVRADSADAAPMSQLRTAAGTVGALTDAGDAALGFFIDQARRAGHSWTEIGVALGVTKQAAQQRHVARAEDRQAITFERFTDRARRTIAAAQSEARSLRHDFVGTEHLLLAQFSEPKAVAAVVLREAGITEEAMRAAIPAGQSTGSDDSPLPLTPRSQDALAAAFGAAVELGHNYIGTEHLLLGLARVQAKAAELLSAAGLGEQQIKASVVAKLAGLAS